MVVESGSRRRFCLSSKWTGVPPKGLKSTQGRSQKRSQVRLAVLVVETLERRLGTASFVSPLKPFRDRACHG